MYSLLKTSYPCPSPSWCHLRWSPHGHHQRRNWRNRSSKFWTSDLRKHTSSDFSVENKNSESDKPRNLNFVKAASIYNSKLKTYGHAIHLRRVLYMLSLWVRTVWKSIQCPIRDWMSSGPALHESSLSRLQLPAWQWYAYSPLNCGSVVLPSSTLPLQVKIRPPNV